MTPQRAIVRFCLDHLDAMARRLEYRLRRMPASGIYGDGQGHRTLWDEFCYEVQYGSTALLEWSWEATLEPYLDDLVERLPLPVARLLSWHLASLEDDDPDDAIRPDLLREAIRDATKGMGE